MGGAEHNLDADEEFGAIGTTALKTNPELGPCQGIWRRRESRAPRWYLVSQNKRPRDNQE